ncbi:MAG: biotin/lipoyl-containing protein [Ottowia sp.]|nr:biotin attachment protein [Ottowia sp.]
MADVRIPTDLWDDDTQAVITSWAYDDGTVVKEGDMIVEIMVEKSQFEIAAPASGTLHIRESEDAVLDRGAVIATIE